MLKKFAYGISTSFLKLTLFLAALLFAAWAVFGNSQNIKSALSGSGLYDDAISSVIDTAGQQNGSTTPQNSNQVPLDQPEIKQIIQKAFPPQLIQTSSEAVINGVYGWLQGKTQTPEFTVDITNAKQQLITGVGDYAQNRYSSLPLCTPLQIKQLRGGSIDPLNVECRSPLVSSAQIKQQVQDQLTTNSEFLNKTVYTGADLPKTSNQQTLPQQFSEVPKAYNGFRFLPLAFGLLSILFALGVVMLSRSKTSGVKSIGVTLVMTGAILFIATFATNWLFNKANYQVLAKPSQSTQIQTDGLLAAKYLVNMYNKKLQLFYVTYLVLGALLLGAVWYKARRQKANQAPMATEENAAVPQSDTEHKTAPPESQESTPPQQAPAKNTSPRDNAK